MKTLKIIFVIIAAIFSMAMTDANLRDNLETLSNMVRNLNRENLQLKREGEKYRLKLAELQLEKINDRLALEPIRYFTEAGYDSTKNPWAKNPDHLRNVWKWTRQYRHLLNADAQATVKNFDIEYFIFAWFMKETHYNPYAENKNSNGTFDWGMAQINDICWNDLYKNLPENLKTIKNPKKSAEVSVAMIYLWINDRVKMNMSYCYLSPEGWTLVWRLNQIEKRS